MKVYEVQPFIGDVRTKFVLSNQDGFFGRTYILSREKNITAL